MNVGRVSQMAEVEAYKFAGGIWCRFYVFTKTSSFMEITGFHSYENSRSIGADTIAGRFEKKM